MALQGWSILDDGPREAPSVPGGQPRPATTQHHAFLATDHCSVEFSGPRSHTKGAWCLAISKSSGAMSAGFAVVFALEGLVVVVCILERSVVVVCAPMSVDVRESPRRCCERIVALCEDDRATGELLRRAAQPEREYPQHQSCFSGLQRCQRSVPEWQSYGVGLLSIGHPTPSWKQHQSFFLRGHDLRHVPQPALQSYCGVRLATLCAETGPRRAGSNVVASGSAVRPGLAAGRPSLKVPPVDSGDTRTGRGRTKVELMRCFASWMSLLLCHSVWTISMRSLLAAAEGVNRLKRPYCVWSTPAQHTEAMSASVSEQRHNFGLQELPPAPRPMWPLLPGTCGELRCMS